jgi:hypothetical protein
MPLVSNAFVEVGTLADADHAANSPQSALYRLTGVQRTGQQTTVIPKTFMSIVQAYTSNQQATDLPNTFM